MILLETEVTETIELLNKLQKQGAWVSLIFIVLFIIAVLWFKHLISKVSEQAKSDVTKKDIEEITHKVESVKKEFTKEIELLKTDLLFKNTVKGIIYNDRKQVVIKLYESYQLWHTTIENHLISCRGYTKAQIIEAEKEIEKCEFAVGLAETNAELYILNENFFQLSDKYYKAVSELEDLVLHFMIFLSKEINIHYFDINDAKEADLRIKQRFDSDYEKSKTISANISNLWFDFRNACFKIISTPLK